MSVVPTSYIFNMKVAPRSRVEWGVKFVIRGKGESFDWNYMIGKGERIVAHGITDRPFTMNAAMTILSEYLDDQNKKR